MSQPISLTTTTPSQGQPVVQLPVPDQLPQGQPVVQLPQGQPVVQLPQGQQTFQLPQGQGVQTQGLPVQSIPAQGYLPQGDGTIMVPKDLHAFTIPQLKYELKLRELKVGGKKAELIQRLNAVGVYSGVPVSPEVLAAQKAARTPTSKAKKDPMEKLENEMRNTSLPLGDLMLLVSKVYGVNLSSDLYAAQAQKIPEALPLPTTEAGLMKLKVVDLRAVLKARNLKISGKKIELVHRILNPNPTPPPVTNLQPAVQTYTPEQLQTIQAGNDMVQMPPPANIPTSPIQVEGIQVPSSIPPQEGVSGIEIPDLTPAN
jgi:hypothetical protein